MYPEILNNIYLSNSIKKDICNIAKSDATVLIAGESGVGKEVVAQAIHNLSKRSGKEAVFINIAAIPLDLIEKELFGSVEGAFTDSIKSSAGKFQQADGTTLVLDEIGELPLVIQGKILSAIENGIIQPIGSTNPIKVDCRIIAITNKKLPELVNMGLFRKDLYFRLNVLSIKLPPLKDRISQIKKIAENFLTILSPDDSKYTLTEDAIASLLGYSWPGNLRELKNVIERAIVMSDDKEITSDYLLLSSDNNVNITQETLKDAVNLFKKRYITQALEINGWNVTKTAKLLDIQRTYLSRLIKELNIE